MHDLEERLTYSDKLTDAQFAFQIMLALLYYSWKQSNIIYKSDPKEIISIMSEINPDILSMEINEEDDLCAISPEVEEFMRELGYRKYEKLTLCNRSNNA